jgi:hypothetical protein
LSSAGVVCVVGGGVVAARYDVHLTETETETDTETNTETDSSIAGTHRSIDR